MADESAPSPPREEDPSAQTRLPEDGPKRPGRPKKGSRPKIDIDEEIEEANRLAEVTRKIMQAAKAAQRNSRRTKQRLVRKAGKLSPGDLERIATLKRCGLFVAEPAEESTSCGSGTSTSSSGEVVAAPDPRRRRINEKLMSVVEHVDGAAELFASMHGQAPSAPSSAAPRVDGTLRRAASSDSLPGVARGRRLSPAGISAARPTGTSSSAPEVATTTRSDGDDHESQVDDDVSASM